MGELTLGIVKGVTLGGCMIWFIVDYVVIMFNCLAKSKTIETLGYKARFPKDEINTAFWIAIVGLIFHFCFGGGGGAAGARGRGGDQKDEPLNQAA